MSITSTIFKQNTNECKQARPQQANRLFKSFPKIEKSTDKVVTNQNENKSNDTIVNTIPTLTQLIPAYIPQYMCHFMACKLISKYV